MLYNLTMQEQPRSSQAFSSALTVLLELFCRVTQLPPVLWWKKVVSTRVFVSRESEWRSRIAVWAAYSKPWLVAMKLKKAQAYSWQI
jgi:hypothetical protein